MFGRIFKRSNTPPAAPQFPPPPALKLPARVVAAAGAAQAATKTEKAEVALKLPSRVRAAGTQPPIQGSDAAATARAMDEMLAAAKTAFGEESSSDLPPEVRQAIAHQVAAFERRAQQLEEREVALRNNELRVAERERDLLEREALLLARERLVGISSRPPGDQTKPDAPGQGGPERPAGGQAGSA